MLLIGHRGARGLSPENTLASIDKAIEHGVDMVEIDVRVTKDGVAILHHDPMLVDPNGTELSIATTRYAELLRHKQDLAALDHTIRHVAHRCAIMIEIKPGVHTKPIITVIEDRLRRGWRLEEFSVASYDPSVLARIKTAFPDIELVVIERWSGVRASFRARRLGTKRVSMNQRWLWSGYLRAVARGGYRITPYTMNDPRKVKRWQSYLYGVITDRPDYFEKKRPKR